MTWTTTWTPQSTFLGYVVQKCPADTPQHDDDQPTPYQPAYLLFGPKGAKYALYRNLRHPHMMYAASMRTGQVVSLRGNSWFSDRDGYLVAGT